MVKFDARSLAGGFRTNYSLSACLLAVRCSYLPQTFGPKSNGDGVVDVSDLLILLANGG